MPGAVAGLNFTPPNVQNVFCLPAGQGVFSGDDRLSVESVTKGEEFETPHEDGPEGPKLKRKVVETYKNGLQNIVRLRFRVLESGREFDVRSSVGHRFYVRNLGYEHADRIPIGSEFVNFKDQTVELVSRELESEPELVYNFQVEEAHTYFVGDDPECCVLGHNQDCDISKPSGSVDFSDVPHDVLLEHGTIPKDWRETSRKIMDEIRDKERGHRPNVSTPNPACPACEGTGKVERNGKSKTCFCCDKLLVEMRNKLKESLNKKIANGELSQEEANGIYLDFNRFIDKAAMADNSRLFQGCWKWVQDIPIPQGTKGVIAYKGVTWDYIFSVWTTGWFSNEFIGGHAGIEVIIDNEHIFYIDNGWWGPVFRPSDVRLTVIPGMQPPTVLWPK